MQGCSPDFSNRILRVRTAMAEINCDAILMNARADYAYLTGFNDEDCIGLLTNKNIYLFTDSRYIESATIQAKHCTVIEHKQNVYSLIYKILKEENVNRLGVDGDNLSAINYVMLKEEFSKIDFVFTNQLILKCRMVKDQFELTKIIEAQGIMERAFDELLDFMQIGKTEVECAAYLDYTLNRLGSSGTAFDTIFVSGANTSMPHGRPGNKRIESGDAVTVDFGAIVDGYCSDMTRTFFIDKNAKIDVEIAEIYDVVLNAQLAAISSVKVGISASEVDKVARDYISNAGFGAFFGHGTGHGIGLQIHEAPTIGTRQFDLKLENNMVFTIEPGIYIPGVGGVRIEDVVIVNNDNTLNITKTSKQMLAI